MNAALVSRSALAEVKPLGVAEIRAVIDRAIAHPRGFPARRVAIDADALELLAERSGGDARRALGALEIAACSRRAAADQAGSELVRIGLADAEASLQSKRLRHDRDGDAHYDLLSALIKSMRGSDADAAIHWLAMLLAGGEDPRIVARRIAILASEDIGLADPRALEIAAAAWAITERVGMPECQLTLAHAVLYMAQAPKSNATAQAIWSAMAEVKEGRTLEVPEHLRDRTGEAMRDRYATRSEPRGSGEVYRSPHDAKDGLGTTNYLPEPRRYYEPTDQGFEAEAAARLEARRRAIREAERGSQGMRP